MPEATDPAASALQPIRDRAGIVAKLGPPRPGDDLTGAAHRSAADVPRLLKAAETALTGAGTLDAESARFGKIADDADPGSAVEVAALAASQAYDRSARILREAITAELTENDSAPAGAVKEDRGP